MFQDEVKGDLARQLLLVRRRPDRQSKLTVVVFGEAGPVSLRLLAGGDLGPLHVGVALQAVR